jgi:hypothetical protein
MGKVALVLYSFYYLFYTLFALKKASLPNKIINLGASWGHAAAGFTILRFARKALS